MAADQQKAMTIQRNREILAQRMGYPPATVRACRELEERFPGWSAWYDPGDLPGQQGPHYAARRRRAGFGDPILRAESPDALAVRIGADQDAERERRSRSLIAITSAGWYGQA